MHRSNSLPPCHSRRELGLLDAYFCAHPKVHAPLQIVSREVCNTCTLSKAAAPEHFRESHQVRAVSTWSVGVTTAPRKKGTLEPTLASVMRAGWSAPHIFTEPGVVIPKLYAHLPLTQRGRTTGAFPNWYLALAELVMLEPRADAFMLVQDDVVFAAGVRDYLERILWPSDVVGAVSVYCPSHYAVGVPPGFHVEDRGWGMHTAQVLVFPNPSARLFLADAFPVNHRHHGPRRGLRNIDCVVGHWCVRSQRPFFVHSPSLAQHVGETSTLYRGATARGRRAANTFVGEEIDVSQLLVHEFAQLNPVCGEFHTRQCTPSDPGEMT